MKIKSSKNKEKVSDVVFGTVFRNSNGEVFFKTMVISTYIGFINAINLSTGTFALIPEDELVEVYPDAELTL